MICALFVDDHHLRQDQLKAFLTSKAQDDATSHTSEALHVLIADDHKVVRDNLRALLAEQQPHWQISEAANGQEAIELIRENTPDVAVLDIVMEPIGGVAAAYDIRRIAPATKIVFISSHYSVGEASIVTRLLGAGAFVSKTDVARSLVPTIVRLIKDKSQPV